MRVLVTGGAGHLEGALVCMERVHADVRARRDPGREPRYDVRVVLARVAAGENPRSPLARSTGAQGRRAGTSGPCTVR